MLAICGHGGKLYALTLASVSDKQSVNTAIPPEISQINNLHVSTEELALNHCCAVITTGLPTVLPSRLAHSATIIQLPFSDCLTGILGF